MSVITVLEQAQGGRLMDTIAASLDIDAGQTRKAMAKLCPAIAARLQDKARADEELFQSLLDLIADNAEAHRKIAEALLQYETLDGVHVMEILKTGAIQTPIAGPAVAPAPTPEAAPSASAPAADAGPGLQSSPTPA